MEHILDGITIPAKFGRAEARLSCIIASPDLKVGVNAWFFNPVGVRYS